MTWFNYTVYAFSFLLLTDIYVSKKKKKIYENEMNHLSVCSYSLLNVFILALNRPLHAHLISCISTSRNHSVCMMIWIPTLAVFCNVQAADYSSLVSWPQWDTTHSVLSVEVLPGRMPPSSRELHSRGASCTAWMERIAAGRISGCIGW